VVVSSAVDTSVGLAAGVALAAALPELPYACGLATMSLLAGDVTAEPLTEAGGELPVRPAVVDQAELARWEVDARDWRARLLAAAQFLPAQFLPAQFLPAQFPATESRPTEIRPPELQPTELRPEGL
jgi:O-succinylbenzoate synthase